MKVPRRLKEGCGVSQKSQKGGAAEAFPGVTTVLLTY